MVTGVSVAKAASASSVRSVTILGSTGTIGKNTLDLIGRSPEQYDLVALTAQRNVTELAAQAKKFRPRLAVVADETRYPELRDALAGTGIATAGGRQGLLEAADAPADWVMAAIVGSAGLEPTLACVRRGASVALANKECLVSAGPLFIKEVAAASATLLPVDSEHNAIFQVLGDSSLNWVSRITLTASGGPFRNWTLQEMQGATPQQAVRHPNWTMGAKISVDSATLMNKGLELIEAAYLFPVGEKRLDILVHPQSIVHSLVAFSDGSVLAQLAAPDMRTPIAHTLAWPRRIDAPTPRLDLAEVGSLDFEAPDPTRFPSLRLARESLQTGGLAPTILNAANEVAVAAFLDGKIGFLEIVETVEATLGRLNDRLGGLGGANRVASLDDVFAADDLSRQEARRLTGCDQGH